MKKFMMFALVVVVLSVTVLVGAVPPIPPIPEPTLTPPPEEPEEPEGGGVKPRVEQQQKFEVISIDKIMEGHAGGLIEFNLKVLQKGYPELTVHLTAEVPDKWKAQFSINDFDLSPEQVVELKLSLSPPEDISAEKHEIKIRALGEAKEDSLEVKDSETLTVMTYIVDVGVTTLQVSSLQPRVGESVTVTVLAVNYTQRMISDVTVEFLVNNGLISKQTVTLTAGSSQPVTFGWTVQSGDFTFVARIQAAGDTNRRNNSVTQKLTFGGLDQVEAQYQQAILYFTQGNYTQARDLFSFAATEYTNVGEYEKASEASQYKDLCTLYIEAETYMDQGEWEFQIEHFEQAAQNFEQAATLYSQIGDTENLERAQQRLEEALHALEPGLLFYLGITAAVVAVVLVTFLIFKRRSPAYRTEQLSQFRLEEPVTQPVSKPATTPQVTPTREPTPPLTHTPPGELVQFHEKTEEALSRFTKGYIRDNLQQAMRMYLSLEGEKKQLPKSKDLELERIIDANLKELEHRIFGTF